MLNRVYTIQENRDRVLYIDATAVQAFKRVGSSLLFYMSGDGFVSVSLELASVAEEERKFRNFWMGLTV